MQNKAIWAIAILIIAGAAIYFFSFRNSGQPSIETPIVKKIDWNARMPAIRGAIRIEFPDFPQTREVGLYKEGDITGDGVPEALVYTGSGGAYTDGLILIQMKDEKPVLAQFKNEEEIILPLTFLSGSSVRHGESVDISSKDQTIYSASWTLDENGEIEACDVGVYLWNKDTGLFEYDRMLSDGSKDVLCNS